MGKIFLFSNNRFPALDWALVEARDEYEAEEVFLKDFKNMPELLSLDKKELKAAILSEYSVEERPLKIGLMVSSKDLKSKQ